MGLTDKFDALLDMIYHVEHTDVIETSVVKSNNGDGYKLFIDHLRVKDPSNVRMNRIRTELNDIDIPSVEDSSQGIRAVTLNYKRRITYLFGMVFEDIPILERTREYEDGRRETREVIY